MPDLTKEFLKHKIEMMNQDFHKKNLEYKKWLFLNGSTRDILIEEIKNEFKSKDTVNELIQRLFPLNIMKKVTNKISKVYAEQPTRKPLGENDDEHEMIQKLEMSFQTPIKMPISNRLFNVFKKNLYEIYLDKEGIPRLRVLPPFTYYAFSHDDRSKEIPDLIVKNLCNSRDPNKQVFTWYTDERFLITDGYGNIKEDRMAQISNKKGVNPFGTLPFIYLNTSEISTEPVPVDDLYYNSIAIPIVLSDLSFGSKYQAWSLIYTIGMEGDLPSGPNSVVHLDYDPDGNKPEVNQLKPQLSITETISLVKEVLNVLLWSYDLQADGIGGMDARSVASGISKAIDNADLASDKNMQQAIFQQGEYALWMKTVKKMYPVWMRGKLLNEGYSFTFRDDFDIEITMQSPKATMTEGERVDVSKKKLEYPALSTRKRELEKLNPSMNNEEIEKLEAEIMAEENPPIEPQKEEVEEDGSESQV